VQPWSHYLNEISLATAGPPLSGAMEDCSIVRAQQLKMLYRRRRCCMSAISKRLFHEILKKYDLISQFTDELLMLSAFATHNFIELKSEGLLKVTCALHQKG